MTKKVIIIGTVLIGIFIYIYISMADFTPKEDLVLKKIEELEHKIDSLNDKKDSIRVVLDSTHVKIVTNEQHYQERINTILVQPSIADSEYISNYIERYIESHSINFQ